MARSYRHISEYEEEILRLKADGKTKREIGEILGFGFDQIHNFLTRYNEKQRKISAGITIKIQAPIRSKKFKRDYHVADGHKSINGFQNRRSYITKKTMAECHKINIFPKCLTKNKKYVSMISTGYTLLRLRKMHSL